MTPGRRARVAASVVLATLCVPALARAAPFADVPADSWPYHAIQTLAADGLIDGYPDGAFKGDRPLSRYEMAAIVARVIAKIEAEGALTASKADLDTLQKLTSVLADELDALGVRVTALENELAALHGRTTFAQSLSVHGTLWVSGTSCRRFTKPTIRTLAAEGLIDGYPDGAFRGGRPLTRYELAAIAARIMAKIETEGAQTASKADLATLQRLTGVLSGGLDALGVRVSALEGRLAVLHRRTALAQSLSVQGTLRVAGTSPQPLEDPTIRMLAAEGSLEGSSDGALTRGRPLTRYETAAIVARVIAKIEAEGALTASKADLDTLQKLTSVLAGELDALGVRVTALEDRLAALDSSGGVRRST